MSSGSIRFLFDCSSPNAYLSHRVIPAIEVPHRGELRIRADPAWRPVQTEQQSIPAEAFADIPNKRAYGGLEVNRFVNKHRLDRFRTNPHFPVNTLKIMRDAIAAQALDCFAPYVDAMFAAMWEQARDMDKPDEITSVLRSANLDVTALIEKLVEPDVKALCNTTRSKRMSAAPLDHRRSSSMRNVLRQEPVTRCRGRNRASRVSGPLSQS